ncbi:MAG: TolC family protein [Gemmataceae bacterium]|nr:TolC family protein [Gemmataceae bacterium]
MRTSLSAMIFGGIGLVLAGCAAPSRSPGLPILPTVAATPAPTVIRTANFASYQKDGEDLPSPNQFVNEPDAGIGNARSYELSELIALTLERNPRLAQVTFAIDTARGRAIQAGLYPNPNVNVTGNELGDRKGPSGIWSAYTTQEIVTANKLGLSQSAAFKEVDQATLNLVAERYRIFTEVRQAFFEALTLERRAAILADLVKLAEQSVDNAKKLLKAKEAADLDLVQLEVDQERYRAELEATRRALPGAYRKLAASVGVQDLPIARVSGDLDTPLPEYELDRVRVYVLGIHPEIRAAQIGVERARLLVRRAEVEAHPNVTVGAGYTRQGQNRSNDWDIGVSVPVPLWNKNQGNILAAKAQVGEAINQVGRIENDLANRLAASFSTYAAAQKRTERYKSSILPKAQQTYRLSLKAYQGGQFEYLRVLAAQRTVAEANLELVRSLGEMWRAGSEVGGFMLEDQWPLAPVTERKQP